VEAAGLPQMVEIRSNFVQHALQLETMVGAGQ
jgi:hypothetical protein